MSCVNRDCSNDPLKSMDSVLATYDGDFACCQDCLTKHQAQRDHFFTSVITDDNEFEEWLGLGRL